MEGLLYKKVKKNIRAFRKAKSNYALYAVNKLNEMLR